MIKQEFLITERENFYKLPPQIFDYDPTKKRICNPCSCNAVNQL